MAGRGHNVSVAGQELIVGVSWTTGTKYQDWDELSGVAIYRHIMSGVVEGKTRTELLEIIVQGEDGKTGT